MKVPSGTIAPLQVTIMANTYHQLYIQTVFPVKYRKALIHLDWKSELQAVIGSLINETGCKTHIVNGMEDHMHCFFDSLSKPE